jgi:hypothetical protein
MVAVGNRYSAEGVTIPGRERKRRRVAGGHGVDGNAKPRDQASGRHCLSLKFVAIFATMTAATIRSSGLFSPLGPFGMPIPASKSFTLLGGPS